MSGAAARVEVVRVGPNPGPQALAFASSADITVYGGGAGGGKTHLALLRFGVHADRHPGYEAAIFRREMPMVTQAGGLWEESVKMFPMFGAKPNFTEHSWRWRRDQSHGSLLQFKGLQHEKDMINLQGAQLAEFCLDEATHFTSAQFWWLFSRLRSTNAPSFRPRCLLTCNPDPDSWVAELIAWYIGDDGFPIPERCGQKRYFVRDGDELVWGSSADEVRALAPHITADPKNQPKSLRFIPALLRDNPRGDPNYESMLNALPRVERERLKGGNWKIRASAGSVFKRQWFDVIDQVPSDLSRTVRCWDLAATEPSASNTDPDWTRGVKMSSHKSGVFCVQNVASTRSRPHDVERLIMQTAQQDGRGVGIVFWQDPGAAGKSEADRYVRMLAGYNVRVIRAASDKVTYARPTSSQAERGNVKLLRGAWNDAYLAEHEAFPDGKHDDIVDAESLAMLDLTTSVEIRPLHIRNL
jgi:predicted phage terminase large subunit-like protein